MLDCMSNFQCHCCSKLCKRQNFQVLKPNANCVKVTFAASCSLYYTLQVNNVNCVVPPAGYIPQKWGVRRTPHTPRWRRPCSQSRIGDYRLVHDWQRSSSRVPYLTFVIQLLLGPLWLPTVIRLTNSYFPHYNTVRSTLHTNFFHLIAILHMAPDPVPITIISYKNSPASMNVIICFVCYVNTVSRLAYRTFYIIMYATLLQ